MPRILAGCLLALALALFLVPPAAGSGCVVRAAYPGYYAPYYQQPAYSYPQYTPVLAATFVPVPLAYPTYNVQYQAERPPQTAGQETTNLLLLKLLDRLAEDVKGLRQQPAAPPPPVMPPAAAYKEPAAAPALQQAQPVPIAAVFAKCAACHEDGVAGQKGNGFRLTQGGAPRALAPAEALKVVTQVYAGKMPPGRPLSDQEVGSVIAWAAVAR